MKNALTISIITLLAISTISWMPLAQNSDPVTRFAFKSKQEEKLKLNNGKRWKANPETTTGVNNMINKIELFSTSKNVKKVNDYNNLSKEMRVEMNGIFDKCTMKGLAHDNLHTFLIPIFGQLKSLESDNLKTCEEGLNALDEQLEKYADYFE